jgi:hypothetical protein
VEDTSTVFDVVGEADAELSVVMLLETEFVTSVEAVTLGEGLDDSEDDVVIVGD